MADKKITYEKALERLLISCEQAYSEFGNLNDSNITYKGYTIFKDDYDDIKLLEEAIEKAKLWDNHIEYNQKKFEEINKEE